MGRFCPLRGFMASSLIRGGWGFAVPFYFVQDCSFDASTLKSYFRQANLTALALLARSLRISAAVALFPVFFLTFSSSFKTFQGYHKFRN